MCWRQWRNEAFLDTHALLWWLSDDQRLGQGDRALIADPGNDVLVSVASLWEIVVKIRVGKLLADIGAIERAIVLTNLPLRHRDPFDHLLIAQALDEDALIVSDDRNMPLYAVRSMRCSDG